MQFTRTIGKTALHYASRRLSAFLIIIKEASKAENESVEAVVPTSRVRRARFARVASPSFTAIVIVRSATGIARDRVTETSAGL